MNLHDTREDKPIKQMLVLGIEERLKGGGLSPVANGFTTVVFSSAPSSRHEQTHSNEALAPVSRSSAAMENEALMVVGSTAVFRLAFSSSSLRHFV